MIDFLRANTWCSREEYMWKMTIGQVRLSAVDFSHVEYNTDKEKKHTTTKIGSAKDFAKLGGFDLPTIGD